MGTKYDIESDWDDPFEHTDERRGDVRFSANFKIMIALESGSARRKLVGPAIVKDLSPRGLYCVTKHDLVPGHDLTLRFPTDMCPDEMCLPKSFYGPARVVRTVDHEDDLMFAGIEFGDGLTQNMEFALYLQQMETQALFS